MDKQEGSGGKAAEKEMPGMEDVLNELEALYWVPILRSPFESLEKVLEGIADERTPLEEPLRAFVSNLTAAKDWLDFPYMILVPFVLRGTDAERRLDELRASKPIDEFVLDNNIDLAHDLISTVLRGSKEHLVQRPEILSRLMHQACLLTWGHLRYSVRRFL